ncbi:HlyD family secretion protein [Photobacterium kishitanii]|uniref:HlyD family secretion protein n=1 Tax=Photobacterium kishitanii TaxID=318456 RepID=A0A2T3KM76_9GAMM|nr:HlyD family efflux transporter periplasmic adaptor subunit [Photobacterium kishitanii]PSV00888.1 hypothetical protein C9J27_02345 [Photobacterium kishitanii]
MKLPTKVFALSGISLALTFIALSHIEIVSPAQGVVDVTNSTLQIKSPSVGYVSNIYVDSGSSVKVGQPLIAFANQDLIYKTKSLKKSIANLVQKSNRLEIEICSTTKLMEDLSHDKSEYVSVFKDCNIRPNQISSVDAFVWKASDFNKYKLNVKELATEKKREADLIRENMLLAEAKISRMTKHDAVKLQVESAEQELNNMRQSLSLNDAEVLKLQMEVSSKKNSLFNEFSQKMMASTEQYQRAIDDADVARYELQLYELKIKRSTINSPIDGVVLSLEKNVGHDYYLGESEPIMILKRLSKNMGVTAKFATKYRSSINVGMRVSVMPTLAGNKETFSGAITHISEDSFEDEKTQKKTRYYKVKIKPDREIAFSEGTEVMVYALGEEVSVLDYVSSVFITNKTVFEPYEIKK